MIAILYLRHASCAFIYSHIQMLCEFIIKTPFPSAQGYLTRGQLLSARGDTILAVSNETAVDRAVRLTGLLPLFGVLCVRASKLLATRTLLQGQVHDRVQTCNSVYMVMRLAHWTRQPVPSAHFRYHPLHKAEFTSTSAHLYTHRIGYADRI